MNLVNRLKIYLEEKGITSRSLAITCGIDPSNLIKMLKNEQNISKKSIDKIIANTDINPDWLLTGEGEMLRSESEPDEIALAAVHTVPLVPVEVFAGPIQRYIVDGVREKDCRKVVTPVSGAELAIPVSGDSMSPDIPDGSTLFLARINDAAFIPWGNVMVLDTENGAVVKRIYPSKNSRDAVEARSINPEYPPFDVPKESIRGIYRVLAQSKFYPTM
jgi:phage repressor protein C with HTH and peptisase S24 domain